MFNIQLCKKEKDGLKQSLHALPGHMCGDHCGCSLAWCRSKENGNYIQTYRLQDSGSRAYLETLMSRYYIVMILY